VDGEPHRTSTLGRGVGASSHRLRKLACEQVTDTDCLSVMHARDNRVFSYVQYRLYIRVRK
jgi:hypothetical protein